MADPVVRPTAAAVESPLRTSARSQAMQVINGFGAVDPKLSVARTPSKVAGDNAMGVWFGPFPDWIPNTGESRRAEIGVVDLYPTPGAAFAVVRYDLVYGGRDPIPSCLIGRTEDAGANWSFVDGHTVTLEQLRRLLPDLPADLQLPATPARAEAARTQAELTLREVAVATNVFQKIRGKLPGSLAELTAKDERGNAFLEALPKDPWGNDYTLHRDGAKWWVASAGPDGKPGTDDDLVSERR